MIEFKTGDLFLQDAEALVNTVNCVGVMGRGVALQFKKRFPDNF
jgi:O-acetyl-ADP-ribose deacetylase (regulator of RNase III)